MSITTITNTGEIIIPPEIQSLLNLNPGDEIEFVVTEDGKVYLQPPQIDVEELFGILHKPGIKPVSVEEMNNAIEECGGEII